jgi:hypothetical protein
MRPVNFGEVMSVCFNLKLMGASVAASGSEGQMNSVP